MQQASQETPSVVLLKCQISITRWSNCSPLHAEPLIADEYLKEVYAALEKARQAYYAITIQVPFEEGRIWHPGSFFSFVKEVSGAKDPLHTAIRDLQQNWPLAILEARERLGDLFLESDLPSAEDLPSLFSISFTLTPEGQINSVEILDKFSILYKELPESTIWDYADAVRKVEEEMKKPPRKAKCKRPHGRHMPDK